MVTKKYLIVLILRILETHTAPSHPMSQVKIAETISSVYPCDRKTVGRNIKALIELGHPIVKTPKGYYMDKMRFTPAEVDYVLRAIRAAEDTEIDKEELCSRVYQGLTKCYRSRK